MSPISEDDIVHPLSKRLQFPIFISFIIGLPYGSLPLILLTILAFSSMILYSPNVIVPPLASMTAPGWTMHPSPKLIWPYKSAASQIITVDGFADDPEDLIDVFGSYLDEVAPDYLLGSPLEDVFPIEGLELVGCFEEAACDLPSSIVESLLLCSLWACVWSFPDSIFLIFVM